MESQTRHQNGYGQLFIVATPIGNLADITYRAVETLKQVDAIAAEDTRTSRKLLRHYGIDTPMFALHEHNEAAMAESLLPRLVQGENIALISDAGTPLISDPGFRLVQKLRAASVPVVPVPGPSSIIAALCASGLPTDHFRFAGFLPRGGKSRSEELARIADSGETTILLESPRRLAATLKDLASLLDATRQLCVARELTKLHEEFISGTAAELLGRFEQAPARGEIVLLIDGAGKQAREVSDDDIRQALDDAEMRQLPPSARARVVAKRLGISKARVYALSIDA